MLGVLLLTTLLIWSGQEEKRRTTELHTLLSATQMLALQLTQELGYGGLIHNFQNLVLHPGDVQAQLTAISSATTASSLVTNLEQNASRLGVVTKLQSTSDMIGAYWIRLERVAKLHASGLPVREIDEAVHFDDDSAIREIQLLLETLSQTTKERLNGIENWGTLFFTTTVIGTIILGGLAIGSMLNQRQKKQYLQVVESMNLQLESSNRELSKANTSLKQFAGIASHDLQSPLRHIRMFSDLIIEDYDDRKSVQEHVERIRKASGRMDGLIASLLEFTLAGFADAELKPVSVNDLVNEVLKDLQPNICEAAACVSVQLEGQVMADHELLERVFHNLICNSIKYTKPGIASQINIASYRDADNIFIAICDNGIGIEPRFAERIFMPFERLHDSQSYFKGSGIGLSLVRSVIEAHGGIVRLDTSFTDGTRIEFSLGAAPS